jgi:hypothetical protein
LWPSWVNDNSVPPPAYEDIFPDADPDRKPRSAAEARAMLMQPTDTKTIMPALESLSSGEPGVLKIGRKNAITKEQQDIFLKAHEAKFKRLSRDRNLFFIWVRFPPIPSASLTLLTCIHQIPLLICMLCALLYRSFPGALTIVSTFVWSFVKIDKPIEGVVRGAHQIRERIVEV